MSLARNEIAVRGSLMPATAKPKRPPRPPAKDRKPPKEKKDPLAIVRELHPTITAEEFSVKFFLSVEDKFRLQGFALEYLKDFNITQAACRMGYPYNQASAIGLQMLYHSYTQLRLSEMIAEMTANKVVSVQQVIARLWQEANAPDVAFSSNASTRISALTALAKILRLGEPKAVAPPSGFVPAGVMIVPMAASPDEWGKLARQSQKALKESTYIDAEIVR